LPYILVNKQLTADYSDTEFEYNITTSKTDHKLIVKNGHVYESNRVIKSSIPPVPKPRPPPVVVKPPVPKPRPSIVVVTPPIPKPRPPPVVVKPPVPKPRPPPVQSSVKQYSKIEFVTQQKANNIKNKILTNLQKYFTNVSITSIKKVGDKFEYVYTVKNPPENYRDIVLQYNKAVPALAILIKKKYAHKKI
jgi:hypothetical protein